MLDLDLLGKEEKENWVWHGAQALKPDYKLALDLAFARRRRRERGSRIRPDHEVVRQGRIRAAGGQEPDLPGATATACLSGRILARAR